MKVLNSKVVEKIDSNIDFDLMTFEQLDRKDYKNAVFWNKEEWAAHNKQAAGVTKSKTKELDEKTPSKDYLTTADGDWIGSGVHSEVLEHVRLIYSSIDQDAKQQSPSSWDRHATERQRNFFRASAERQFPFLKLCAHGWKAKQLAIDTYPHWRQHHRLPAAKVDQSTQTGSDDAAAIIITPSPLGGVRSNTTGRGRNKRKNDTEVAPTSSKHARTSNEDPLQTTSTRFAPSAYTSICTHST